MTDPAAALEEVLATRTPALLRTAFLLSGDAEGARDLLQSALERVTSRLGRIRDAHAVEAYLRATMATTAANQRRRMWQRETPTAVVPERDWADPTGAYDLRMTVLAALQRLTPEQRVVIVLRFYDDMTEVQIAHTLGIAVGTVKSRTARALVALRASGMALDGNMT